MKSPHSGRYRDKIKTPAALAKIFARSKKKTVFTNGCFDILHRGHVTYLEKARALGDVLIVALNTDSSTKRLKGPTRPLNPLEDRLEVIAALESVSYVTWFDEDIPTPLISKLKPRIVVKGGDYSVRATEGPRYIEGTREVREWGGKTAAIPVVPGRSTSKILKKLGK